MEAPQKKSEPSKDLAISLLGIYLKELKAGSEEILGYPCSEQHYSQYGKDESSPVSIYK